MLSKYRFYNDSKSLIFSLFHLHNPGNNFGWTKNLIINRSDLWNFITFSKINLNRTLKEKPKFIFIDKR